MKLRVAVGRALGLGATPVFVLMSVVSAGEHAGSSTLSSMWLMYACMALFHAGPWLSGPNGDRLGIE